MPNEGARRLKAWRLKHKLTQFTAAIRLNMSPSTVSHYETGASRPDRENAAVLHDVAGIPVRAWDEDVQRAAG
jgi:transcriptional regulator with XRE-family HTH domain